MNDFEVNPIGTAQRLAELERDAARYRWLKKTAWTNGVEDVICLHKQEDWDSAIDKAMGEK